MYICYLITTRAQQVLQLNYRSQGCFRQNITVVTIYTSLGDDALIHSLNEVSVLSIFFF